MLTANAGHGKTICYQAMKAVNAQEMPNVIYRRVHHP